MEYEQENSNTKSAKDILWFKLFDAKRKLFQVRRVLKGYNVQRLTVKEK